MTSLTARVEQLMERAHTAGWRPEGLALGPPEARELGEIVAEVIPRGAFPGATIHRFCGLRVRPRKAPGLAVSDGAGRSEEERS